MSFDIIAEGISPETYELVQHIKQVAEKLLFHWKSFPIILPQPLAVHHEMQSATYYSGKYFIVLRIYLKIICGYLFENLSLEF